MKDKLRSLVHSFSWKEAFINGITDFNSINDYIDIWHEDIGRAPMPLSSFLGLTEKEYALFVENPQEFEKMTRKW